MQGLRAHARRIGLGPAFVQHLAGIFARAFLVIGELVGRHIPGHGAAPGKHRVRLGDGDEGDGGVEAFGEFQAVGDAFPG